MTSIFRYPGAKSRYADWIIDHFPAHECYVEPFGGSGAVLIEKGRSQIEVYNDRDENLVQFFEVLRDRGDELAEWLQHVPYSRSLYEQWSEEFYAGNHPDDPVERAGRFYFLRFAQFSGRYDIKAGFSTRASHHSPAATFASKREELNEFSARFDGVIVEHLDYRDCIEQYDGPDTLFYFDPPYVDAGDSLYSHGQFDHEAFVDCLGEIEGNWVTSYSELPAGLEEYTTTVRETWHHMAQGHGSGGKTVDEQLVMNFDAAAEADFAGANQSQLPI